MNRLFPICLLLLQAVFAGTQNPYPKGFPAFQAVQTRFFNSYDPDEQYISVDAIKKPEGYYIVLRSKENFSLQAPMLFWSAAQNKYLPLALPLGLSNTKFASAGSARDYDLQPFYGYAGWYKDAIAFFEKIPAPNDDELYALGRAWFQSGLVLTNQQNTNFAGADSADLVRYDLNNPRMSPDIAEKYAHRVLQSGAAHKKLMARNPNFQTLVGNIDTEYANNLMHLYLWMGALYDEKKARSYLPDDLYRPFIRQQAYNMLQSCPPNAILMTYGDTDTYPLLYLQAKEGVRPDVSVVNTSLLYSPYYNRHLRRDTVFGALPLQRLLPQTFYDETPVVYHYSENQTVDLGETISLDRFLSLLQNGTYRKTSPYYGVYHEIPVKTIEISMAAIPGPEHASVPDDLEPLGRGDKIILSMGQYSLPDQLTELDWIAANGWSRPLCFSLTCNKDVLKPYAPYLLMQGLVYRVAPMAPKDWEAYTFEQTIDVDATWRLWTQQFKWSSSDAISPYDCLPFYQTNYFLTLILARQLVADGDWERAKTILDDFCRYYPNDRIYWNVRMIHIARMYADNGDRQEAEEIILAILDNYDHRLIDVTDREDVFLQKEYLKEIIDTNKLRKAGKRYAEIFKN